MAIWCSGGRDSNVKVKKNIQASQKEKDFVKLAGVSRHYLFRKPGILVACAVPFLRKADTIEVTLFCFRHIEQEA